MNRIAPLLPAAWLACTSACTCSAPDLVAEVGDAKLHLRDLDEQRRRASSRREAADPEAALEALVDKELLAQAARSEGLPADSSVAARLRAAERELLARAYLEKKLEAATTEEALRKRYEEQRESLTKRTVHVRHIVLRIAKAPTPEEQADLERAAHAKAIKLYARLRAGEDFEALARELSEDAPTAQRGGDLGELMEGQVSDELFEAAAALKAGEVSEPVRTRFGFHLLQAVRDPSTRTPPFEEVRATLAAEARRDAERALLEELKGRFPVRTYEDRASTRGTGRAQSGEPR